MSPSLDLLLTHYRHELASLVVAVAPGEAPPCPPGEELLWAEAGEEGGWLAPARAMEVRRLAGRVRFYEGRARSA
jgi:hypothetical protein